MSPFFVHNFYENILSKDSIDSNLIYIFTLLLKQEIDNIDDFTSNDNKFLEKSRCSILLEELRRKNEVQNYFKNIIEKAIEKLEDKYNSIEITFYNDELAFNEKKIKYLQELDNISKRKKDNLGANLINKYLPLLSKEILISFQNKKEYKDDTNMNDFLYIKILDCEKEPDIYSNKIFISSITDMNFNIQEHILNLYQFNFMIVINFIDEIIKNITENLNALPYSIKCICKIISELLVQKFASINLHEKTIFLSKFLFGKLLLPYLLNPNSELYMSNFLSENTLKSLKKIVMIFNKFVSCSFFYSNKEPDWIYTPFNLYFIYNIQKIFNIFDNINKVELPSFIDNIINNNLFSNYSYDYFKENPDEIFVYRSIFFNLEQFVKLINIINNNKEKIFKNEKTENIKYNLTIIMHEKNKTIFKSLLNSEISDNNDKDNEKKKRKDKKIMIIEKNVKYFLITSLEVNEKYKKLFELKRKDNFSIKELNAIPDNKARMDNNIIRTKNMLSCLLNNIDNIEKNDFIPGALGKTESILEQLNSLLTISNDENDNIPPIWFLKSFLDSLKNIPYYLKRNDYEEIFYDLEKDINNSIKELDFGILSEILEKLKYGRKKITFYKNIIKNLNDWNVNINVRDIINNYKIPVKILFKYDENANGIFIIKEIKENKLNINKKSEGITCNTIREFIQNFPNLVEYEDKMNVNIFKVQKELKFPEKINNYINIIIKTLNNTKDNAITNLDLIINKIDNYLMQELYNKIFRLELDAKDNQIYQKSIILSWVELNNFIKSEKELLNGNFVNEIIKYFNLMENEKSINNKFKYLNKIFDTIELFQKLNGKENYLNIEVKISILRYAVIKAQLIMLESNVEFMELYIKHFGNKIDNYKFELLKQVCEIITKIDDKYLFNVTKKEFNEKCIKAREQQNI